MALMIFFCLGGLGAIFLLISACFGDVGHDIDHDISAEVDHDTGGSHWFSIKVISAFLSGYGGGGGTAVILGVSTGWATIIAFAPGVIFGVAAELLIRFFYSQQASTIRTADQLINRKGTVNLDIDPGRIGEVFIDLPGESVKKAARAKNPQESIPFGTSIVVVSADTTGVIVEKA